MRRQAANCVTVDNKAPLAAWCAVGIRDQFEHLGWSSSNTSISLQNLDLRVSTITGSNSSSAIPLGHQNQGKMVALWREI